MVAIGTEVVIASAGAFSIIGGDTFNVKTDFGAAGDGITNDTLPIDAAITAAIAAGGATVFFPAGTYLRTSRILIPSQTATLGNPRGLVLLGDALLGATIAYAPSVATAALEIGDGVVGKTAGNVTVSNLAIDVRNSTATGAIKLVDNCGRCSFQDLLLSGVSTSVGDGIQLVGQTVSNALHKFSNVKIRNFLNPIHLSGFAVGNVFEDISIATCTNGILAEPISPDTLAGAQNHFLGVNINGGTAVGLKFNGTFIDNNLIGVVCDGPTVAMTASTGTTGNNFIGCNIPISTTTLTGASATSNNWIGCAGRSTDAIRTEIRLGEVRLFRSAANTVTLGTGNDGLSAANLISILGDIKAPSFRIQDGAGNDTFQLADAGATSFFLKRVGGSNVLTVNVTDDVGLGKSGGKLGLLGATPVVRDTGWAAATGTKTKTTYDTTTVTLPVLAAHVGALTDFLIARGDIGA